MQLGQNNKNFSVKKAIFNLILPFRAHRISRNIVIVAGVSCSGKSFFISNQSAINELSSSLPLPYDSTSKFSLETLGYNEFLPRKSGTTFLHVEINPDPTRTKRKKWLLYAKAAKAAKLILIAPERKILIQNVYSRSVIEGDDSLRMTKESLYTDKWLGEQYRSFIEMTSENVAISSYIIYSQNKLRYAESVDNAKTIISSIYSDKF